VVWRGLVCTLAWAISAILRLFYVPSTQRIGRVAMPIFLLVVLLLFGLEHSIVFTFSQVSFLLAFAGICQWFYGSGPKNRVQHGIESIFLLLAGLLLRRDFATLAISFGVTLHGLLYVWSVGIGQTKYEGLIKAVPTTYLLGTLAIAMYLLPGRISAASNDLFRLPVLVQDYHYEQTAWTKNGSDSLQKECIYRYFTPDTAVFNEGRPESITMPSLLTRMALRSPWREPQRWKDASSQLWKDLLYAHHATIIWFLLFVPTLAVRRFRGEIDPSYAIPWATVLLVCNGAMCCLSVYVKLNNRLLGPLCTAVVLSSVFFALQKGYPLVLFIIISLICMFWSGPKEWTYLQEQRNVSNHFRESASAHWAEINRAAHGRTLVTTIPVYYYLLADGDPLVEYPVNSQLIQLDGWTYRLPWFQTLLESQSQLASGDFASHLKAIFDQGALLIGDERSIELLTNYFGLFYQLELSATQVHWPSTELKMPVNLYQINMNNKDE